MAAIWYTMQYAGQSCLTGDVTFVNLHEVTFMELSTPVEVLLRRPGARLL